MLDGRERGQMESRVEIEVMRYRYSQAKSLSSKLVSSEREERKALMLERTL
jgi:hypothetical protein